MPDCTVAACRNRSSTINFKKSGITYHRFPKDLKIKEKWMDATGRTDNWFPTHNSTICSSHFEETCFQPSKTSRRLFSWAVPTLKLRLVFDLTSTELACTTPPAINATVAQEETSEVPRPDTPQKKNMRLIIAKNQNLIKAQKLLIKSLQTTKRRYIKKFKAMKDVLSALKEGNLLNADHLSILDKANIGLR